MDAMMIFPALVVGLLVGAAVSWSLASSRLAAAKVRAARLSAELEGARGVEASEARLTQAFAAVSREALDHNTRTFLDLAGTRLSAQQAVARGELEQRRQAVDDLVGPLRDALQRVETSIAGVERARQEAYAGLSAQVRGLAETHDRLRTETTQLASALRSSQVRGRWGEVQLRRVVELAGMVPHCDFVEQPTVARAGTVRRPDLVVHLPGGRHLAVDAKVPLSAYLEAHGTADEDRRRLLLRDHARQLRAHVNGLADKEYWAQFTESPDIVVLFLPGEPFLAAAFEDDPSLFEYAHARRVLIATPTTLIALLQSVALGWRQEAMAANARNVCEVGQELYKRLSTMGEHVTAVGRALDKAVDAYNRQVGSLESRVLVTARKLATLEVGEGDLLAPEPIDRTTRLPQTVELTRLSSLPAGRDVAADPDRTGIPGAGVPGPAGAMGAVGVAVATGRSGGAGAGGGSAGGAVPGATGPAEPGDEVA
jgi:DNA recombination protein RmuC